MIESYDSTGKMEVMASEGENKEAIEKILHKYSYIEKYYKHYIITSFMKKQHPLISLIFDESNYRASEHLAMLNNYLEKLDSFSDVSRLIKKTKKYPTDFFNIMSEFKVASLLIDKVDEIKVIVSKNSSPDFKIEIFGKTLTIEVKRIEDKRETLKGNIKYNPDTDILNCEWVDYHTIYNSIKESIIKKKQYYPNIPHIIMFDCSSAGIVEDEFEDVLYSKKDKNTPLIHNRDTTGKIWSYGHHVDEYDGVFYKKNGEEDYSCLSGVAAIFGSYTRPNSSMGPRIVFFRNPNADLSIDEEILSSWGMKICKITEE